MWKYLPDQPKLSTTATILRNMTQSGWRDLGRSLFTSVRILNIFQITKLQMGELVYKHRNSFLPDIYDSYFMNENQRGPLISYTFNIKPNPELDLPQPAINGNKIPLHTKMVPSSKALA